MRIYTADESGLVKSVSIDPKVSLLEAKARAAKKAKADAKARVNASKAGTKLPTEEAVLAGVTISTLHGTVQRDLGITHMSETSFGGERAFVVARQNGSVDVISQPTGSELYSFSEPEFSQKLSIKSNGKFITSTQYVGVGAGPDHFISCTNLGQVRYQSFAGSSTLMKLPVDVCRMRTHVKRPSIFTVGGREQELTVWDAETLETKKPGEFSKATSAPLFKSKNVANDSLDLRVPVWITDMQFTSDDASTIAVASGYKHIRLYDTRANQRPVQEWTVSKHPILNMLKSHVKPELFFADNMGNLLQMDMRKGNVIGGYKEIAGAVRAIALSEDGSKVAAAGLDRFVRVYETGGTRAMLHRAYVKQRVTGLVYDWSSKDIDSDEEEQQETEAIWGSMRTASDKKTKRKRRTLE